MDILPLLAAGAASGLMAGLFGVGGGVIIVPVLALLYQAAGLSADVLIKVAVGTSLATIIVTSLSSIRSHHKRGAVDWAVFGRIAPGILLGSLAGAFVADVTPGRWLYIGFVAFLYLMAARLFLGQVKAHGNLPGALGMGAAGAIIGIVSALMGIGGGSLSVPYLTWCGMLARRAVATSAAIGLPIAVAGTAGFVYTGLDEPGLPPHSLGYVHLPALGGIVAASVLFAPLGARLAHRLPDRLLKRAFALFLFVMASRMLYGLF